ncbi:hypothetical protein FHS95_002462 [Sphingomonas naasensis]|uniref:Type II secretion system protein GspC N-terminal domain-containing protein n=1 Tax=Sphingomonas naasensis TaxID=1344951 RepID=A0A4S1WJ13_9SPHN|nr:hypothetical protein [Sphingomonas naasensis]NIJ20770.1 hypothetical protein [Sphingomonas naasensis]TGX43178.1 hypothetical protein E5A74_08360 [Sphingomonas naasensis]
MSARHDRIAVGLAGGFAVLMPLFLLVAGKAGQPAVQEEKAPTPLVARQAPPLVAAFERPLFAKPAEADAAAPGDAPALIGIVGRLGQDAVALVRTADGTTRALQIGESVDGWQLASLAIDAAYFTRGAQRVRVPLPVG